jgi:hypothetical protein
MFNLTKGITLFFNKGDGQVQEIGSLIDFLNQEYNFIFINTGVDKFGLSSLVKSIHSKPEELSDTIKNNQFRLNGVCIYIPQKLKDYNSIWNQLKEFENLHIIVICPDIHRLSVIPIDRVVFRQIYELKDNPKWFDQLNFKHPLNWATRLDQSIDRYIFVNSLTEDEFTLHSFKLSYIRDKKIDIFLDNDEEN